MNSTVVMNLGLVERWAAIAGGVALISYGVKKGNAGRAALGILGGDLIYTGVTGYSGLSNALGLRSSKTIREESKPIPYRQGIRVDKAITIGKSREELFSFWRNLENLPRFMRHIHSVTRLDDRKSHWIAQSAGKMFEWDAEVINEEQDQRISWQSLPGAHINTAGSVHFKDAPGGRGTEVLVELQYLPPAGAFGAMFAKLLGRDPADQIQDDLRRLKQLLETGETATIEGQSHGAERFPPSERHSRRSRLKNNDTVRVASEESFPASDPPAWTEPPEAQPVAQEATHRAGGDA